MRIVDKLRKRRGDPHEAHRCPGGEERILDAVAAEDAPARAERSILFLTTHKCASTFVAKLLAAISASAGYRHFDYNGARWRLGNAVGIGEPLAFMARHHETLFRRCGEIYGPLRAPVDFPGREDLVHVFFLRDPRDLLVSKFYSIGWSHALPPNEARREGFLERRHRAQEIGIDAYCLEEARSWILPVFEGYATMRETAASVHLYRYDAYKDDPLGFLRELRADLGLAGVPDAMLEDLAESARPVSAPSAGPFKHKRSGASGQFRTELAPDTVAEIDDLLGGILDAWGFSR